MSSRPNQSISEADPISERSIFTFPMTLRGQPNFVLRMDVIPPPSDYMYPIFASSFGDLQVSYDAISNRFVEMVIAEEESKILESHPERKIHPSLKETLNQTIFCSICQATSEKEEKMIELKCQHVFHSTCISEWVSRKNECPVCRQSIPIIIEKKKTKVCKSVLNKTACWYKEKCRFAHTPSELNPKRCRYGEECWQYLVRHRPKGKCTFLHPTENVGEYCQRLGICFQ